MTTVTVQGVPIYVAERGSGPAVVLLHGDSPPVGANGNAPCRPLLARRYRIPQLRIDHRL
jgi:pimeloyl-ACP methyl ester carboxylesterase